MEKHSTQSVPTLDGFVPLPMPGYSDPGFDTLALHAGAVPDPATGARATPIHLSTSFVFDSSAQAASLFN